MANARQRILRRSKDAERAVGRWFLTHDGPDPRPLYAPGGPIVTSTGRVGHIHDLQADIWTRTYLSEVKNILMPKAILEFWNKVVGRAGDYDKEPALIIVPSNRPGITPDLHIISAHRHAALLEAEKYGKVAESFLQDMPVGLCEIGYHRYCEVPCPEGEDDCVCPHHG